MRGNGVASTVVGTVLPHPSIFRLRQKSLARGLVLSLGAFAVSLRLAGFPHIENLHGSRWQILALLAASWGMGETARCLDRRWNLYHAGVLILLYSNLMILALIVFLVAYP
jgi:hypothetical protein